MLVWLVLSQVLVAATALDNGLGLTPPMGWLSWLYSGCNVDCVKEPKKCLREELIKRVADQLVSEGYRDAGYVYVIIDDCWPEKERGPDGKMVPDKTRFKSGMKAIGDYLHSKGLKFGIYGDIGSKTCAGYPGLAGYEALDAQTFADWGVDYIKVDGCYENSTYFNITYPQFGQILNQTGRPIHYSCSWPAYQECENREADYKAISETCNTWRNYADIDASWSSVLGILDWYGDNQERLALFSGPGQFHDPDMLIAGHPGVTYNQVHAQMSLWVCLAAPLMLSADIADLKPVKSILQHKDWISLNQDPAGLMGERIEHNHTYDVWIRAYSTEDRYFVNTVARDTKLDNTSQAVKIIKVPRKTLRLQSGTYEVRQHLVETETMVETKKIVYLKDEIELEIKSASVVNSFTLTLLKNATLVEDNNIL